MLQAQRSGAGCKQFKIGDELVEAILVAGGAGFKIYTYDDSWIIVKDKKTKVFQDGSADAAVIAKYVNLKYQDLDKQKQIKDDFSKLLKDKVESSLDSETLKKEGYVTTATFFE